MRKAAGPRTAESKCDYSRPISAVRVTFLLPCAALCGTKNTIDACRRSQARLPGTFHPGLDHLSWSTRWVPNPCDQWLHVSLRYFREGAGPWRATRPHVLGAAEQGLGPFCRCHVVTEPTKAGGLDNPGLLDNGRGARVVPRSGDVFGGSNWCSSCGEAYVRRCGFVHVAQPTDGSRIRNLSAPRRVRVPSGFRHCQ